MKWLPFIYIGLVLTMGVALLVYYSPSDTTLTGIAQYTNDQLRTVSQPPVALSPNIPSQDLALSQVNFLPNPKASPLLLPEVPADAILISATATMEGYLNNLNSGSNPLRPVLGADIDRALQFDSAQRKTLLRPISEAVDYNVRFLESLEVPPEGEAVQRAYLQPALALQTVLHQTQRSQDDEWAVAPAAIDVISQGFTDFQKRTGIAPFYIQSSPNIIPEVAGTTQKISPSSSPACGFCLDVEHLLDHMI